MKVYKTTKLFFLSLLVLQVAANCSQADEEVTKLYQEAAAHVKTKVKDLEATDIKDIEKIKKLSKEFNQSMLPFVQRKVALQDKYPEFRRENKEFFGRHHKTFTAFIMTYYNVLKKGILINKQNPKDQEFKDIGYETKFILEAMMSNNEELRKNPASKKLGIID